ncbi:hypothetical protein EDB84DRAFT_1439071 [Lactarius hengduanensis]|nr:hypothetical protein EDB84DRAFT_1439071 [Lactarius hengduanensis]
MITGAENNERTLLTAGGRWKAMYNKTERAHQTGSPSVVAICRRGSGYTPRREGLRNLLRAMLGMILAEGYRLAEAAPPVPVASTSCITLCDGPHSPNGERLCIERPPIVNIEFRRRAYRDAAITSPLDDLGQLAMQSEKLGSEPSPCGAGLRGYGMRSWASSPSSVFLNWNVTGPKPPIAAVAWLSNIFKDGIVRSGVLNYGARLSDEER